MICFNGRKCVGAALRGIVLRKNVPVAAPGVRGTNIAQKHIVLREIWETKSICVIV